MNKKEHSFAEIIDSSITQATGLCWEWSKLPQLCSLVKIQQPPYTLFGLIINIKTGSNDPLRQPFAYQKTEAELLQEQPQIFAFLQTTFTIKILGYKKDTAALSYLLPPQPSKLHNFITYTTPEETSSFFAAPKFLDLFFSQKESDIDQEELLLALLKNLKESIGISPAYIQKICTHRSTMHGIDYKNIKKFMQRIEQIIS